MQPENQTPQPETPTPVAPPAPAASPQPTPAAVASSNEWGGGWKALKAAFEGVRQNPAPFLVYAGITVALDLVAIAMSGNNDQSQKDSRNLLQLIDLLFLVYLALYQLGIADGRKISVKGCFSFRPKQWLYSIIALIIFGLSIAVSAIGLFIPIIWFIPWFLFAYYVIVDQDMGPIAALKESKRLAKDHKSKVWGLIGITILVMIPLILLLLIPFVGLVVSPLLGVVSGGATAILYRWLQKAGPTAAPAATPGA